MRPEGTFAADRESAGEVEIARWFAWAVNSAEIVQATRDRSERARRSLVK